MKTSCSVCSPQPWRAVTIAVLQPAELESLSAFPRISFACKSQPQNLLSGEINLVQSWISELIIVILVQFSSVAQSCPTLCDPMNRSTPGLPVHHQLPESTQTHVHWVGDAIQPFHPLFSPSPPALNLSQHQGLFQSVSSLHQVVKYLQFQLQNESFQWTPRTDLL